MQLMGVEESNDIKSLNYRDTYQQKLSVTKYHMKQQLQSNGQSGVSPAVSLFIKCALNTL